MQGKTYLFDLYHAGALFRSHVMYVCIHIELRCHQAHCMHFQPKHSCTAHKMLVQSISSAFNFADKRNSRVKVALLLVYRESFIFLYELNWNYSTW